MILLAQVIGSLVVLYFSWQIVLSSWGRLIELGVIHNRTFITFFDGIAKSAVLALVLSRLTWMFMHLSVFQDVPWGIVPYVRSASGLSWFSVFPWRFLLFTEGLFYPVLWGALGVCIILFTYIPTLALISKLKVDKKKVMRNFRGMVFLGIGLVIIYTALMVYSSL